MLRVFKGLVFLSGTTLPRDCSEITDLSSKRNGSHTIYPFGVQTIPANVYCEFGTNGTAWTVCLFHFFDLNLWHLHFQFCSGTSTNVTV